jgi:hypothetical protein
MLVPTMANLLEYMDRMERDEIFRSMVDMQQMMDDNFPTAPYKSITCPNRSGMSEQLSDHF